MPAQATLDAEVADLRAKLSSSQIVGNPDLQQAIQDRVDAIQVQKGQAVVFGLSAAVTKGGGKKN